MKSLFFDRSKHNSQQMGTINITNGPDPNQQLKKIQKIQQVQANLPRELFKSWQIMHSQSSNFIEPYIQAIVAEEKYPTLRMPLN